MYFTNVFKGAISLEESDLVFIWEMKLGFSRSFSGNKPKCLEGSLGVNVDLGFVAFDS